MSGKVTARWVASWEAELPGGKILVPGVTTHEIPEGEAHDSDNWEVVVKEPKAKAQATEENDS